MTPSAVYRLVSKIWSCSFDMRLTRGDQIQEREADKTTEVVTRQLNAVAERLSKDQWIKVVIAYEPIWYACFLSTIPPFLSLAKIVPYHSRESLLKRGMNN